MATVPCVGKKKTDGTQTSMSVWSEGKRWSHFIFIRRLIYLPKAARWSNSCIDFILHHWWRGQHNFPHWISLNVSVWYSDAIFSGPVARQRHIIPLCKCCGKFSKASELQRKGTVQPLICAAVCGKDVRGPAMALHPTIPPVALHLLSSPLHPLSRNNGHKGCYSDTRSILLLAGPWSLCTPVNHPSNNESWFPPSPLSSPVFFHCTSRNP